MKQMLFLFLCCIPVIIKAQLVVGYYYGNPAAYPHDLIEYNCLTHIAHAFIVPDSTGKLGYDSSFIYPELIESAHRNRKKIIVSLGGWGNSEGFKPVAVDSDKRAVFISNLVSFIKSYGYDGADIDWEYPGKEDQHNFNSLISELRAAFDSAGIEILSAALPAIDHHNVFDAGFLKNKLSWFGIMTYDFYGPWEPKSGLNTALYSTNEQTYSVDYSIKHWKSKGAPEEKLCMGMELAGYLFNSEHLNSPHQGAKSIRYLDAMNKLDSGWKYNWHDTAKVPYLTNGDSLITIDDTSSVRYKSEYLIENKLAGTIIWKLGLDYTEGYHQLLNVIGDHYFTVVPGRVKTVKPENSSLVPVAEIVLKWNRLPVSGIYEIEISETPDYKNKTYCLNTFSDSISCALEPYRIYYWRVRMKNSSGMGEWSETDSFVTYEKSMLKKERTLFTYSPNQKWDYSIIACDDFSRVRVRLLDIWGRETEISAAGYLNEDVYLLLIDSRRSDSGVYTLVVNSVLGLKTQRITL